MADSLHVEHEAIVTLPVSILDTDKPIRLVANVPEHGATVFVTLTREADDPRVVRSTATADVPLTEDVARSLAQAENAHSSDVPIKGDALLEQLGFAYYRALDHVVTRVLRVLRWYGRIASPVDPINHVTKAYWTHGDFKSLPLNTAVKLTIKVVVLEAHRTPTEIAAASHVVEHLLNSNHDEPLHHEIGERLGRAGEPPRAARLSLQ
jgi:hypothetical protein